MTSKRLIRSLWANEGPVYALTRSALGHSRLSRRSCVHLMSSLTRKRPD